MTLTEEDLEEYQIINYFEDSYQEYWRQQMLRTDWEDAKKLTDLLENNSFFKELGAGAKLIMLTDGESLISYCAATAAGEIKYLYTSPSYRGNGCAKKLICNL